MQTESQEMIFNPYDYQWTYTPGKRGMGQLNGVPKIEVKGVNNAMDHELALYRFAQDKIPLIRLENQDQPFPVHIIFEEIPKNGQELSNRAYQLIVSNITPKECSKLLGKVKCEVVETGRH